MPQYDELTEEEQQTALKRRIKEVEQSQFMLRLELNESLEIQLVAVGQDLTHLEQEVASLQARITYGEARMKALRRALDRLANTTAPAEPG